MQGHVQQLLGAADQRTHMQTLRQNQGKKIQNNETGEAIKVSLNHRKVRAQIKFTHIHTVSLSHTLLAPPMNEPAHGRCFKTCS